MFQVSGPSEDYAQREAPCFRSLRCFRLAQYHVQVVVPIKMCVYRQEAKKKLPEMFWSKVDLRQLAQHKEHSSGLGQHNGPNARRTLRKMDTSKKATGSNR